MKDEVFKNAMKKAQDQMAILIDEETPQIKRALSDAAMVASQAGKDVFSFKLRFAVEIEPCGDDMNVGASIGYALHAAWLQVYTETGKDKEVVKIERNQ
jgi:hypothetical protein